MPLQTIKFVPGVAIEVTPTLGQAQIVSSQLIRFKYAGPVAGAVPEKLGGWTKFYPLSLGSAVRDLHAWEGLRVDSHVAAGCESSLDIISAGVLTDVTPRTLVSNVAPSFTTVNGSPTVTIDDASITASIYDSIYIETPVAIGGLILMGGYTVTAVIDVDTYTITAAHNATSSAGPAGAVPSFATTNGNPTITVTLTAHGFAVGEIFNVPTSCSTTVGGLTIVGAYVIQSVPTANTFTINAEANATATTSGSENGGNVQIAYYIGIGPTSTSSGYGTSTYGSGGYGIGTVPAPSPGTPITATNWSLDNWGEILLACVTDGAIYQYSTDSGIQNATRVINSPQINGGIFVSQPAQILVSWASSQGGVQDKLTINWSDSGDYTNWTVSSQTQAGGYHIPTGSRIVSGMSGPNFNIIWTDVDVWAMDYIEPPLIFGFNSLGSACGLISQHAKVVVGSLVYWMSNDKFCILNGESVQSLPCPVWDFIFQDLDTDNVDKIYAGSNSLFNEITFYFPSLSGGTGEIDSYVKFNIDLNVWDFGRLARSAWIDQSPAGPPIGGTPDGFLYQHETSPDADGQPMSSWFESGYFAIGDGENLNFVDWIFPDFKYGYYAGATGAVIQISIAFTDYPNTPTKSVGPYSVTSSTPYVNTRLRGRFASFLIESTDTGSFWRLGAMKVRTAPDGKR